MSRSHIEHWLSENSEAPIVKVYFDSAVVNRVMTLADRENWPVEKTLAACVVAMHEYANNLVSEKVRDYLSSKAQCVVVGETEYRYVGPQRSPASVAQIEAQTKQVARELES